MGEIVAMVAEVGRVEAEVMAGEDESVGFVAHVVFGPSYLSGNSIDRSCREFLQCRRSLCSFLCSYFSCLRA